MLPLAPFLALSEADQPTLVWWIMLGAIALGPALHSWIKVIEFFKGKKFDPANYVTQDQLAAVKAERDAQIAATIADLKGNFDRLEKTLVSLNRELPTLHRIIGRLEGHDEAQLGRGPR
jgi:uncharacterized protein HemX